MRIGWAGKVALGAVLPVILGLGTFALIELNHVERVTFEQIRGDLRGVVTVLAHTLTEEELRSPTLQERARQLARATGDRVTIVDASGAVLADSSVRDPSTLENHGGRPEVVGARRDSFALVTRYSRTVKRDLVYAAARIPGTQAVARIARDLAGVEARLRRATGMFPVVSLLVSAISILAAVLIARGLARPLRELQQAAGAVEAGELTASVHPSGRDEVADLGRAFNRMTTRLRETVDAAGAEAARLTTLLEGMSEGVIAVDAEERISFMNSAAGRILSVRGAGPFARRRLYEVVRDPRILGVAQMAAGQHRSVETEITQEGPPRRTVLVHGAPVGGEGSDTILVLRDLSHLRRLERMRSDFVSNVSHELRTPLASIAAAVETLADEKTRVDPESGTRFVEMIRRNVARLEALLNDLLALARLESQPDTLPKVPVDLSAVLRSSEEEMHQRAEGAGVDLVYDGQARVPVLGDAQTLRRIVDNLIVNAILYTPAGGKVIVRVYRDGDDAVFQVRDTGIGIPRSEQDRIFERFYRVDKARSRSAGGTGLGLAIVKHAIGLHDGTIEVESTPREGSTFTARIPWAVEGEEGDGEA